MPTLQFKSRPRLPALLLLTIGLAQLATPVAASIAVEIHGVDESMRPNVLAYLSFERYKTSKDLSQEFVERLQERAEREVRAALRPFGFYEPVVTSQVRSPEPGDESRYTVIINVVPGKPVVVDEVNVTITGPGATDSKFTDITSNLAIRPGQRLNHAQYDELKGRLLRTAATYGYHDSRMVRSEMRVDPAAYSADIELAFETGQQYRFGATTISQAVVEDSLVRRFLRYREDQPFDATELLRTQFALDDSQYFATVEVLPGDRDREKLTVPISIAAEPNRRNRYQYGVGYGTDTEIRGTISWENRRVNERGHRFRTEIKAAALEQSLDARYIVPIGDPATEKFTLQLKGGHERLADIDDRSINFMPSLTHLKDSWFSDRQRWQRVTYLELLNTESEFIASGRRDEQTLLIPGISFALVPPAYLGEARFPQHARFGFRFPPGARAGGTSVRLREQVARAGSRRHRCDGIVGHQRVGAVATFLRGRRPQRARLRHQRPVASPAGIRPGRQSGARRRWRHHLRKGGWQTPLRRIGRTHPGPAQEFRDRGVRGRGQRIRPVRRSAHVLGGNRRAAATAGRFRGHRCRAGTHDSGGRH
jgi:translocation and assembly module TamA